MLLFVDPDANECARVANALENWQVVTAQSAADARAKCATLPALSVAIVAMKLPDGTGADLLRELQGKYAEAQLILTAGYDDLPDAVHGRLHRLVSRVLQRPVKMDHLQRVLREVPTARADETGERDETLSWSEAIELMRTTAELITHNDGVIVRPRGRGTSDLQLHVVLRDASQVAGLRAELMRLWKRPIKTAHALLAPEHKRHPVVQELGSLAADQEVFAARFGLSKDHVYLALLPWRRDDRLTAVVGVSTSASDTKSYADALSEIHRRVVTQLPEFVLPEVSDGGTGNSSVVLYAPEYDWVISKRYVGPDRRAKPTSFLNRFVLIGRRKRSARSLAEGNVSFVDKLPKPIVAAAIIYLICSLVDSFFSFYYIARGPFQELNPLWRWLLQRHPGWFFVGKNITALVSIFVVTRLQLWKPGRYLLALCVAGYVALDVFWIYLALRAH